MKWFKHYSDNLNNAPLQKLFQEKGFAGKGQWYHFLENFALRLDYKNKPELVLTWAEFGPLVGQPRASRGPAVAQLWAKLGLIELELLGESFIKIRVPMFLDLLHKDAISSSSRKELFKPDFGRPVAGLDIDIDLDKEKDIRETQGGAKRVFEEIPKEVCLKDLTPIGDSPKVLNLVKSENQKNEINAFAKITNEIFQYLALRFRIRIQFLDVSSCASWRNIFFKHVTNPNEPNFNNLELAQGLFTFACGLRDFIEKRKFTHPDQVFSYKSFNCLVNDYRIIYEPKKLKCEYEIQDPRFLDLIKHEIDKKPCIQREHGEYKETAYYWKIREDRGDFSFDALFGTGN